MFLYLIQHAEAKREEEDPERHLTEKGKVDIKKVASFVSQKGISITQIFHSGKTRAFETAKVLGEHLKPEKGLIEAEGLSPLDEPALWSERLSKMDQDIAIVGHMPHLGKLSSLLLSGDAQKDLIDFKMGGIVCLRRFEDGKWKLQWMIVPEML